MEIGCNNATRYKTETKRKYKHSKIQKKERKKEMKCIKKKTIKSLNSSVNNRNRYYSHSV